MSIGATEISTRRTAKSDRRAAMPARIGGVALAAAVLMLLLALAPPLPMPALPLPNGSAFAAGLYVDAPDDLQIEFRDYVNVIEGDISMFDVARIETADSGFLAILGQVTLGPAPQPGSNPRRLSSGYVKLRLRQQRIIDDAIVSKIPDQILVGSESMVVTRSQLVSIAKDTLAQMLGRGENSSAIEDLSGVFKSGLPDAAAGEVLDSAANEALDPDARGVKDADQSGAAMKDTGQTDATFPDISSWVAIRAPEQLTVPRGELSLRCVDSAWGAEATRIARADSPSSGSGLTFAEATAADQTSGPVTVGVQVVVDGRTVKTVDVVLAAPDSPEAIAAANLQSVPASSSAGVLKGSGPPGSQVSPTTNSDTVINKGDRVLLRVSAGNAEVVVPAEARQAGRIGDSIEVRSLETFKVLSATVVSSGVVEVDLDAH